MKIKISSEQLQKIIKEEIAKLNEMDRYDAAKMFSQRLANKGIANVGERSPGGRSEYVQLFMGLLGKLGEANEEEVEQLADTVLNFMKDDVKREGVENLTPENLKLVYDVLVKMSPLIAGMSIGPALMMAMEKLKQKKSDRNAMDEDLYGDIFEEEVEKYLEESLYYGLIEEDDELLEKKKKKKACKPSKGKKFARRVKGKCVSYGQAGKAKGGGARIKPGTGKGNAYCARSYGDMKSHGKDCSGKDRGTPLCLSRQKWKCSGKYSRKGK